MDREQARREVRRAWREILPTMTTTARRRVNGEASYICPICGHGTHGDGLTHNPKSADGNGLKCFGCGFAGDVIDLYRQQTGTDYNMALSLLAQTVGISIAPYTPSEPPYSATDGRRHDDAAAAEGSAQAANGVQSEGDFTVYYAECRRRLSDPAAVAYLAGRGISIATASSAGVGFDPAADPAQSGHNTPRIIIPTAPGHYVARSIDPTTPKAFAKMNNKGGTPGIFNAGALYGGGDAVFVTEGAIDALSVLEVGAAAVALNSTANADRLLSMMERRRTVATLILCLDGDAQGQKAAELLRQGLRRLNVEFVTADILCGRKDPNEALQADRDAFSAAVAKAQRQTARKPDNTGDYIGDQLLGEIERFGDVKPTGYGNLDEKAGGLYAGLYAVAAISSLGKTTFCHQMSEQLAAAGHDVLFFSLEQSRLELVSKSLSRRTTRTEREEAVSSLSIRRGYFPRQVKEAAEEYRAEVGDRLSVIEGNFSCDISFIGDYVRRYARRNGVRPVVFIDYLQILQPSCGKGQTVREAVDNSVTELKRLSREMNIPVVVVSSVNRANYLTPIDFESLKESGGIEYSCDVIWGLQLQCLNEELFSGKENIKAKRDKVREAKAENPRKIELVCLKNRFGISSFRCCFRYFPEFDLFEPSEDETLNIKQRKAGRRL